MNWPTLITFARILLVPVFALVYLAPNPTTYLVAAALFALAALTDWLDGFLARRLGQETRFGAFIDPVADKIIVITAILLLIGHHATPILTVPGIIIVGRELVITALREWMAEINRRGLVEVAWLGKIKTALQMVAVIVLLANAPDPRDAWVWLGYGLIYIAAIMTLWSMAVYLHAAWPILKEGMLSEEAPPETVALEPEDR
ncbi:MAG: CDP-diacylglycerol--glycerol-3-phosphate 3-phosphatidyltransferase [Pseudomonadales bacterium]